MKESVTGVVVIQDVEEKTMEKLLEFIYSGKIEETDGQLEMLLYAADKYQITDLVSEHIKVHLFYLHILLDSTLQPHLEREGRNAQKCSKHSTSCRPAQARRTEKGDHLLRFCNLANYSKCLLKCLKFCNIIF